MAKITRFPLSAALVLVLAALAVCLPARSGWAWQKAEVVAGTKVPPPAKQEFAVQVGVFDSEEKARELSDSLGQKQYEPYVYAAEKDGVFSYAVRLGIYENMYAAMAAAEAFSQAENMEAVLTDPGSMSPAQLPDVTFLVQVYAFAQPENVASAVKELERKGFPAGSLTLYDAKNKPWHAVHAGAFKEYSLALASAERFAALIKKPYYILKMDTAVYQERTGATGSTGSE